MGVTKGVHQGQPVLAAGERPGRALAAMVLVHGRGRGAEEMLTLSDELGRPGFCYLAPQAQGNTWYPNSFLAPIESNEPQLSSGLRAVGDALGRLEDEGFPAERTMLLGFSQGACLVLEYALRNPRRYGGVVALTGGLITPPASIEGPRGSLDGTPVFLGCGDEDPFIPTERVERSADVLRGMGAKVTTLLYPGSDHVISEHELSFAREIMDSLTRSSPV